MITQDAKNFENVFDRDVIVALISFLYDSVRIKDVRDGQEIEKVVPLFYSRLGDVQTLQDFFLDSDRYAQTDCLRVAEGVTNKLPSGVLTIQNCKVMEDALAQGGFRALYQREVRTDFGTESREFSARTEFIPHEFEFSVEIRCSSDLERMKIRQELVKRFYRARVFYMRTGGFTRLPVMVGFPSDSDLSKQFGFQHPEKEKIALTFTLEVRALLPNPDPASERDTQSRILTSTTRTTLAGEAVSAPSGGTKFMATGEYTATCPVGKVGAPVTRRVTVTSKKSLEDAQDKADKAAKREAEANLICVVPPVGGGSKNYAGATYGTGTY